jgi:hypothetical protein
LCKHSATHTHTEREREGGRGKRERERERHNYIGGSHLGPFQVILLKKMAQNNSRLTQQQQRTSPSVRQVTQEKRSLLSSAERGPLRARCAPHCSESSKANTCALDHPLIFMVAMAISITCPGQAVRVRKKISAKHAFITLQTCLLSPLLFTS